MAELLTHQMIEYVPGADERIRTSDAGKHVVNYQRKKMNLRPGIESLRRTF
jgi:hypothetical protein